MRALFLISWNDLRQTFSDRTLILLMFAAPLAIATIISVTFGGLADESSPIDALPVAIVNLDRGSPIADFGDQFVRILQEPDAVFPGLTAELLETREDAGVRLTEGAVSAVIVLPQDLSRRLTGPASRGPAEVELMVRPDRTVSAQIAGTITSGLLEAFAGSLALSQAAVAGVAGAEGVSATEVLGRDAFSRLTGSFGAGGASVGPPNLVVLEQRSLAGGGLGFNPLVLFGATQAIFFALFTANGNATSILEEERDGTFVRLLASPTPRAVLLAAKLGSTFVTVLFQLLLLFVAFTTVASVLEGALVFIWGQRVVHILVALGVTAAAATAIGGLVAAIARSPEQSNVIDMAIAMFMAITGGAFGFQLESGIRYASAVYWGAATFETLAAGSADIWVNVAVLGGFAALFTAIAYLLFLRRFAR
jgi:ABC-type transport system involved in multi-copper enzyme maturation permease subunit